MIYFYTITAGFALFALQILFHEWKMEGRQFKANFGSADKVFPRFSGRHLPAPHKEFLKHISNKTN